jgi:hypothetical protein
MKKAAAAAAKNAAPQAKRELAGFIRDHEHVHAANCGHKSYVHGDHIDYEHDGHFHYVLDGRTYPCDGPKAAQVLNFPGNKKK